MQSLNFYDEVSPQKEPRDVYGPGFEQKWDRTRNQFTKKVGFQTPIVKWYHDYFKVKNQSSRNYIYNYINDIKESFNKL